MAEIMGHNMPDDLYYHEEHSWVREEEGKLRVGMTDLFARQAGDIVYVDLPFEDDDVSAGETCGKLQSSKWIGKLVAPVSGTIVEVNEEINDDCTMINKDPYGNGWLVLIEPENWEEEKGNLMQGDAVIEWAKAEIAKAEKHKEENQ